MFWIGKPNIGKMAVLHKLIYRAKAILIRIPADLFATFDKLILKFIELKIAETYNETLFSLRKAGNPVTSYNTDEP